MLIKKIVSCALAFLSFLSVSADEIKVLTLGLGNLGEEPQLMGLGISPDGRYVCGSVDQGKGVFVADIVMGVSSHDFCNDSEMRKVDFQGKAVGYMGDMGAAFTWDGEVTPMVDFNESYRFVIGEDISNDGNVMVGSLTGSGFVTYAAYSRNGEPWTLLPEPPADLLGDFAGKSSAKGISGDGKYIIGHAGSFGPVIMWTLNAEGEYVPDALFSRFCALTKEELDEKPLAAMSPRAISNNGKYVLCAGGRFNEDGDFVGFPVVYNTESNDITIYDDPQDIDPEGFGLTGHAIADDGTFVGIIGDVSYYGSVGCFVMKAGQTQAELFVDAYPSYADLFDVADFYGMCVPTDISADGGLIVGHVFYSLDYYDNSPAFFLTYILNTGDKDAVESLESKSVADQIYSLDGVRLSEMKKGLNIIKMADGTVKKIMKK